MKGRCLRTPSAILELADQKQPTRGGELDLGDLVALGAEIDAGMNAEATLVSVVGTQLKVSACGFSPAQTAEQVLSIAEKLRRSLIAALDKTARQQSTPQLGALVRALKTRAKEHR